MEKKRRRGKLSEIDVVAALERNNHKIRQTAREIGCSPSAISHWLARNSKRLTITIGEDTK